MAEGVETSTVELWLLWKQVSELVRTSVIADVTAASELSEPELTVLVHLNGAGGTVRQNTLAAATGWDRTRLSHLLTRMEARGHLSRSRLRNGAEVTIGDGGAEIIARTTPVLADAVQRHLTGRLTAAQQEALRDILDTLR